MTKVAICTHCWDIVSPLRDWQTDRSWRWCQCEHMAVRWRDGRAGLVEVTATHGPQHVRVIGLNNSFLEAAINIGPSMGAEEWRILHDSSTELVEPHYLFHKDRRACWALVVRPNESGDITFVDYADARWPKEPAAAGAAPDP